MTKTLLSISAGLMLSACSTAPDTSVYAGLECEDLRALVAGQDYAASARGLELYNDRGVEETRYESGSPWAGRGKTRDDTDLREERQAIREAYRRKNCPA